MKQITLIENKTKISTEMTLFQTELETIRFMAANMRIKKRTEK